MSCECPKPKKTDRICNNPGCGRRLTEDSPNWFQCSEECRQQVWLLNNPPKHYDDE